MELKEAIQVLDDTLDWDIQIEAWMVIRKKLKEIDRNNKPKKIKRYRMLKAGDIRQAGDQWRAQGLKGWLDVNHGIGIKISRSSAEVYQYRRPIAS